jgi:spore germination cell wall hydrolase CwlJ-like protein
MFLFAAASEAPAQTVQPVAAGQVDAAAKPLGKVGQGIANVAAAVTAPVTSGIATVTGAMSPAPAVAVSRAAPDVARQAARLARNGWPLYALVDRYAAGAPLTDEANCIATAVYHEARGETLEGQLAVARVIMNRAASGKYPASWCATVKQPYQFSFVNPHTGAVPYTDTNCDSWRKAVGVTRLAVANAVPSLDTDVLWYHATYVAPSWGRRLTQVSKIGAHIFYRA